jgi:hypothetical protein
MADIEKMLEEMHSSIRRIDARTADLVVRVDHLETKPRQNSFTSEMRGVSEELESVSKSIHPIALETSHQTTLLNNLKRHQTLMAWAALIGALAALVNAIFHH